MALTKITGQVINTATDVTVGVLTVTDTLAVGGTVSVGGTLTYEDVTNIDSVGLITARNGIVVGSGITLSKDGDIFATGVTTATKFVGDGSELTGVASTENIRTNTNATFLQNINVSGTSTVGGDVNIADKIVHTGDTNTTIRFPAADTFTVETGGSERLRVASDGKVGINQTPTRELSIHSPDNNNSQIHFTNDDTGETASDGIVIGLDGNEDLIVNNQESSKNIKVFNGGSERLRIDSSGRLLIGVTASYANASIDELQIGNNSSANQSGLTIGSTDECAIAFADAGDARAGSITYNHGVDSMIFKTVGQNERFRIDSSGHVLPGTNDTYDLGSSSKRWRDIYTGDLNLSNKGKSNDVDGSWGDYTIQEGESDLFLINNRSGKKFKFNLTEVS